MNDNIDALSYIGAWKRYKENSKMYIVNPDDEELMKYYKQFNNLTKSWIWASERRFDDTLIIKFGYPMPLSSAKPWQILLYIYSDESMKKTTKDLIPSELWPKYKIVEYIPDFEMGKALMTNGQYQNEFENVVWYIDKAVKDYTKEKQQVMLMTSSPNSYMDRYIRDHFSRSNEKDPYLKWFKTEPEDDCTAAELIWKKHQEPLQSLGTAELTEKSDGIFVKVDYSNLSNMNKSILKETLNRRFGVLSGDYDGDVLQYCKADVNTTLELYNRLEKETRELMKKFTDNNKSKMEAEPFRPMAWLAIKKVIFNNEATIVIWNDDEKTIVKCQEGEVFDKEKGLAMAICKRALGNTPYFNNYFKKWISEATVETPKKKKTKEKKVEEEATEEANT